MIKTEFCNHDFHEGDRVVLVNDDLQIGDCDRHLVPGVEGTVLDFFPAFPVPTLRYCPCRQFCLR